MSFSPFPLQSLPILCSVHIRPLPTLPALFQYPLSVHSPLSVPTPLTQSPHPSFLLSFYLLSTLAPLSICGRPILVTAPRPSRSHQDRKQCLHGPQALATWFVTIRCAWAASETSSLLHHCSQCAQTWHRVYADRATLGAQRRTVTAKSAHVQHDNILSMQKEESLWRCCPVLRFCSMQKEKSLWRCCPVLRFCSMQKEESLWRCCLVLRFCATRIRLEFLSQFGFSV